MSRKMLLALLVVPVIGVGVFAARELLWKPQHASSATLPRERVVGRTGILQPRATPEEENIDPLALRAAADAAAQQGSRALIVSRHGHIVFEQYWHGTTAETLMDAGAFSRTLTALMVGIALEDRKIGSSDEIRARLQSPAAEDLQTLVPLLERATGERYAQYFSRRLWKPLDAADAALSLDRPGGTARGDCCFFARASDWLRIAQLLMNHGVHQGTEIVQRRWIDEMLAASKVDPTAGMQVRLGWPRHGFHLADSGGSRLWMAPALQLAVLRLGEAPRDGHETRVAELVMAGIREQKPIPATDLSTLVPGH
jgi:CubicO group peptidase (beta-lactamase class C family)